MTPPEEYHRHQEQIGAFLLGKLDREERTAMQTHLSACPVCQAELKELAPVVAALAYAAPDRIEEAPQPPDDLEESTLAPILAEKHRARRHRSWVRSSTLAAAAICVVVVGLAGFAGLLQPAFSLEMRKNVVRLEISTRSGDLVFSARLPNESRVTDSEKQGGPSPEKDPPPADSQEKEPITSDSGGRTPPEGSASEGGNKGSFPGGEKPGQASPGTALPGETLEESENGGGSYRGQSAACEQYSCAQE